MRPAWLSQKAFYRRIYLLVVVVCFLATNVAFVEAFTESFHFSGFDDGELISRQLEERGVRFPECTKIWSSNRIRSRVCVFSGCENHDGGTGPRPTRAQVDGTILNYLKTAYPVSDVIVFGERNFNWNPRRLRTRRHRSTRLIRKLWRLYGGDGVWALAGPCWQGIAIVEEGDPLEAQFDVNELIPGRKGLIRITTSDGFNTEVTSTTVAFSVGTDQPPIITGDLDGDGVIDGLDARKLVLLCTRPRCAVN